VIARTEPSGVHAGATTSSTQVGQRLEPRLLVVEVVEQPQLPAALVDPPLPVDPVGQAGDPTRPTAALVVVEVRELGDPAVPHQDDPVPAGRPSEAGDARAAGR
jgi:hypothetical protein